ncbi:MAG: AmmeMemoRadiSam system radical SAM enzyme [Candidatus Zhuqueibacterota bacterium]
MARRNDISRRDFLTASACACGACALAGAPLLAMNANRQQPPNLHEARYYEKLPNRKIRCQLCPRECVIDDMETGYCGVRENHGGVYYTLVYGKPCTANIDPIEKKPLFHFLPGTDAFSIATVGCNVLCKFCQNWQISQARPDQVPSMDMPPTRVAETAGKHRCASIAYTYTEPVIFSEYMFDSAKAGHVKKIKSVMISNGYIKPEPMKDLCTVLDAVKIDLKSFTEDFYQKMVNGHLQPVLDTLVLVKQSGVWLEIVYLIIPTLNDGTQELRHMCQWINKELGPDVPIHFSRFYPQYRLKNLPPTPVETLTTAREIALDSGLHYAYIGNVPGNTGENTYCPHCQALLIRRMGYTVVQNSLAQVNHCSKCGEAIAGVWQ